MPKVSVLMPVYNTRESYLIEAIDSILNQSYKDFELIILNDCSTDDNVEKVVLSYKDPRIVYFKSDINLGISGARNKLVELSRGEYLAVMDHDDISLPHRLEKQVKFLDENDDHGVVGSWHGFTKSKKVIKLPVSDMEIKKSMLLRCSICHPSSMIRKSVLVNNRIYYNSKYSPAEDYELWTRLISKTKFYNIPENIFKYRFHDSNTSKKHVDLVIKLSGEIKKIARNNNYELWQEVRKELVESSEIRLFNLLPFWHLKKKDSVVNHYLFGFIPILSTRVMSDTF